MTSNSIDFIDIYPFDKSDNILDKDVLSDHCEIGLEIESNKYLMSWNISNPKYHTYFKYGSTFKNTHLYVEEPYVNNKLIPSLEEKIQKQLDVIKVNIDSGKFPIQIIIEGFDEFHKRLENIFVSYPNIQHDLIRFEPEEKNHTSNISGILVDTNLFEILDSGIESMVYTASEDNNKVKTTMYPFVRLRNKYTNEIIIVVAVHVNGCASQYPVSGLESLKELILTMYDTYENNIIAIGDYNTPPSFARKVFDENMFNVLSTDYFTHCNPNLQASRYDLAVTYPKTYSPNVMNEEHVSKYSLALIDSINDAVIESD